MKRSLDPLRARRARHRRWFGITMREHLWSNLQVTFWFARRRNVGTMNCPRWED